MDNNLYNYWVYCLLVVKDERLIKACYIGQSKNIQRRLKEHNKNTRIGKGSYHLHELAEENNAIIHIAVLEQLVCDRKTIDKLEADWINSALKAGFAIPGMSNWIKYNKSLNVTTTDKVWIDENKLLANCTPLHQVVNDNLAPPPAYKNNP